MENSEINNHQMEVEKISEPTSHAGFWMRFWAYLIDLLVVSSISGVILGPIVWILNINDVTIGIYTLGGIFGTVISFSYFILLTKLYGQTLGKRIMGIKVLSDNKKDLSWLDVVMRELVGRYIHQALVVTNILYLFVAFHPHKKGLHDMLGDTHVVLEPREAR